MVVHLSTLNFHATFVPTRDFSLWTCDPYVLIDFIKGQASSTEQKAGDLTEVTKLTHVLFEVLAHDTAAESVVRARDLRVITILQMLCDVTLPDNFAALIICARD